MFPSRQWRLEVQKESFSIPDDIRQHYAAHLELYRTDPEKAHYWDTSVVGGTGSVATLMLTTVGRKSGQARSVTLQYFRPSGLHVIVGSKRGMAEHPIWYRNLEATPACEIQIGAMHASATARPAEDEEYERLWQLVTEEQPQYKVYSKRTSRRIPLIILDIIKA